MYRGQKDDRKLVVDILTKSFQDNKSVNYVVKQDSKVSKRIESLMEYSFDMCDAFGEVWISDDRKGCALILLSDKKKTVPLWDAKLAFKSIGLEER